MHCKVIIDYLFFNKFYYYLLQNFVLRVLNYLNFDAFYFNILVSEHAKKQEYSS